VWAWPLGALLLAVASLALGAMVVAVLALTMLVAGMQQPPMTTGDAYEYRRDCPHLRSVGTSRPSLEEEAE
jgi:hypothetical protein